MLQINTFTVFSYLGENVHDIYMYEYVADVGRTVINMAVTGRTCHELELDGYRQDSCIPLQAEKS